MTEIERSALVPWSPEQMFAVVMDVDAYATFLPWCAGSTLVSRSDSEIIGKLEVAKGGIRRSMTTRNRIEPPHKMYIELIEGPFKEFSGLWTFQALGDAGCKVTLHLKFEVDSRLMGFALGRVFNVAADRMVDAFCERAEHIYA